jgi:TetR/AcrR family transcriptional regulator, cholesterol catabolism regulator
VGTPPTSPALRERYERRRADVVDAAARVFAQRGYHATSIEDLIEATGLTRGGLYHYTESKQALLFSVFDELMEPLLARARSLLAAPGTPEQHLRAVVHAWVEHIATHLPHMVVFNQERGTLERDPRWQHLRAARREFEQLLGGVLQRGQENGSFAMHDAGLALLTLLGMVNYTPQWFSPTGRLTPAEIADGYCNALLDGIRARRGG